MDRTIIVQLNPTHEQAVLLKRTLDEHTACFNEVAHTGFTTKCSNGTELHKETYYPLRMQYPDLPSQLVCAARVKATEAVKSALTWKAKKEKEYPKKVVKAQNQGRPVPRFKPVKCPHSEIAAIRYDIRSYWVKWNTMRCSLATTTGRVELPFTVSEHLMQYVGYRTCSADLCYRKGRFTLHVVVSIPEPDIAHTDTVIGIDLGLARPAVTSEHVFLGEKRWQEQERKMFRIRRKLQQRNTKSAKRHLKKLSGKRFRQRKDHDHVLAKRIVQNTPQGSTLVFENLKDIRATSQIGRGKGNKNVETKRRFHSWSFAQLRGFVSYKAAWKGIEVVKVDPRHTSQTCSQCGHQHRSNRRSQSLFKCHECGYSLNADYNAAINIRDKYISSLVSLGTSSTDGLQSTSLSSPSEDEGQALMPLG